MLHRFEIRQDEADHDGARALTVIGELDIATAPRFRRVVGDLMAAGVRHVEVDLSGTELIDSSGLGALLWAEHRLRAAGGSLELFGAAGPVARTFALAGLSNLVHH